MNEDQETSDRTSCCILFSVRDSGIGVPADRLQGIFEPFEQADNSTTRRFGGSGLGLAISARLAELMGGQIWAESEVGRGSRFHFTAQFGTVRLGTGLETNESVRPRGWPELSALVVDDNATTRRWLGEMLSQRGIAWRAVDATHRAQDAYRESVRAGQPFSLLVVDAHLADGDGTELCAPLANGAGPKPARFIVLTSPGHPESPLRRDGPGRIEYLTKPVKRAEFYRAISALADPATAKTVADGPRRAVVEQTPLAILLAEDGAVNQKVATRLLEKRGHTITIVANGRAAVAALACEHRFDLALMDVSNAIDHGNLGLDSELRVRDADRYLRLADERRALEPYCNRRVHVLVRESPREGLYTVGDEGPGFDPSTVASDPTDAANLERPYGRGLFLIRMFMHEVRFNERGNEITMIHRRGDLPANS